MKLISMVDFVLERKEVWRNISMKSLSSELSCRSTHSEECEKYANFLKQPLELGMFVPYVDGRIVEKPTFYTEEYEYKPYDGHHYKYQRAKERVLFVGAKMDIENGERAGTHYSEHIVVIGCVDFYINGIGNNTVEELYLAQHERDNELIELTKTAQNQIGV